MPSAENFALKGDSSFLWHTVPIIELYRVCCYTFKCLRRGKCKRSCLSNASRFPKEHYVLDRSQASSVCYCGNSNIQMKMSTEQWWNVIDRGKSK
jgi:MinD superfamily P-loop ATPase